MCPLSQAGPTCPCPLPQAYLTILFPPPTHAFHMAFGILVPRSGIQPGPLQWKQVRPLGASRKLPLPQACPLTALKGVLMRNLKGMRWTVGKAHVSTGSVTAAPCGSAGEGQTPSPRSGHRTHCSSLELKRVGASFHSRGVEAGLGANRGGARHAWVGKCAIRKASRR